MVTATATSKSNSNAAVAAPANGSNGTGNMGYNIMALAGMDVFKVVDTGVYRKNYCDVQLIIGGNGHLMPIGSRVTYISERVYLLNFERPRNFFLGI